jgi:hypothetical protein
MKNGMNIQYVSEKLQSNKKSYEDILSFFLVSEPKIGLNATPVIRKIYAKNPELLKKKLELMFNDNCGRKCKEEINTFLIEISQDDNISKDDKDRIRKDIEDITTSLKHNRIIYSKR